MQRVKLYLRLFYNNNASFLGAIAVILSAPMACFSPNAAGLIFSAVTFLGGLFSLWSSGFGKESLGAYDKMMRQIVGKERNFRFLLIVYNPHCVLVGYRLAINDAVKQKLIERPMVKGVTWY